MFFPRLRRQAKWVFVFLAAVFTLGFVVFGVGSGGGIGLGDLFNSNGSTKSTVSESAARKRIQKNPRDAGAYLELSKALETNGDVGGAIAALEHFTRLKPKNVAGLTALAGLYTTRGSRLQPQIQTAQAAAQAGSYLYTFNTGLRLNGQLVVPPNPIFQSLSSASNNRLTELYRNQQQDFNGAENVYGKLARLQPKNAPTQYNLGFAAESAGDVATAIAAYRRFTVLAPDDPTTALVKRKIKALKKAQSSRPQVGAQAG